MSVEAEVQRSDLKNVYDIGLRSLISLLHNNVDKRRLKVIT